MTRAGASIPLRATADFNSARRLREDEVVTPFGYRKRVALRTAGAAGEFQARLTAQNFSLAGQLRRRRFLTRSISADVEYPAAMGTRTTLPPSASTTSRPTIASSAQSAPFTSTSGRSSAISS